MVQRLGVESHIRAAVDGRQHNPGLPLVQQGCREALLPPHILKRIITYQANVLHTSGQRAKRMLHVFLGPVETHLDIACSRSEVGEERTRVRRGDGHVCTPPETLETPDANPQGYDRYEQEREPCPLRQEEYPGVFRNAVQYAIHGEDPSSRIQSVRRGLECWNDASAAVGMQDG